MEPEKFVSRVAAGAGLTDIARRVFCPLMYVQALLDHDFSHRGDWWWYAYDVGRLPHCDELVLPMLPALAQCERVWIEVEAADALGIRTTYMETPETFIGLTPAQSTGLHLGLSG